jgi:dTDP-4-amino-4,6-dideoxy-D-galactose acyltransferase
VSEWPDKLGSLGDLCTLLPWDTEHWGFPVARLNETTLTEEIAAKAIQWCEKHRIKCLYFAADGRRAETLQLAEKHGFRFVDVRVDLERGLHDASANIADGACREAVPQDLPAIEQLARTAHEDSRFFKDTSFDRATAGDLYAIWIARDLRERRVFVAVSAGEPTYPLGYVSVSEESGRVGRIGLVAVIPEARGGGLGNLLVQCALAWCRSRDADFVRVATQGTNVPALRLYECCGFKTADVKVWFHRWFGD